MDTIIRINKRDYVTIEAHNKVRIELENLKNEFEQYKRESVKWCWEDVISVAENANIPMTQEEAQEVLEQMIRKRDASIGINWDVISVYVHLFQHDKLQEEPDND